MGLNGVRVSGNGLVVETNLVFPEAIGGRLDFYKLTGLTIEPRVP